MEKKPKTASRGSVRLATNNITLEQWCRALAAHAMLTAHNNHLHGAMAPELIEGVASFILRFAKGEPIERPTLRAEEDA
jgi:hypothetical protein